MIDYYVYDGTLCAVKAACTVWGGEKLEITSKAYLSPFYHLKPKTYGIDATYGRIGSERGERFGVTDLQTPYETYLYWIRYYEKLSKGYVDSSDVYLTGNTINKTKQTQKKKKAVDPVSSELYQKLISYANHVVKTTLQNAAVTVEQVKRRSII